MLGWYWVPGNVWGPAWVSWASGGDYIGWCPLGHDDRPAAFAGRRAGRAVPRGTLAVSDQPWAYVRRADFASADLARRIQTTASTGQEIPAVEHAHARPDRDLHLADGGTTGRAVPRNVRPRPAPGGTTPELRADTPAAGAFPVARRRHREPDAEAPAPAGPPAAAAAPRASLAHPVPTVPAFGPAAESAPSHPTDARHRAYPADARSREARPADADREVLRRVFGPLSQPHPAESGDRAGTHARPSAESPRPTPARPAVVEPSQPVPSPAGSDHAAPRSQGKKDH
jgi:hypothetical protein